MQLKSATVISITCEQAVTVIGGCVKGKKRAAIDVPSGHTAKKKKADIYQVGEKKDAVSSSLQSAALDLADHTEKSPCLP